MNRDGIIKFPNTKRKLSLEEEKLISKYANHIHNEYQNTNPFVKPQTKLSRSEETLKELVHNIFELNEE
tara:strand:+ start:543 stop:749 length:207 start_codon:yes stop_codon:yes gene_type:complete